MHNHRKRGLNGLLKHTVYPMDEASEF